MTGNPWIVFGLFPLAAYVIGSTPFGPMIARFKHVDLRKAGSGNVGATNVGRVLGRPWGCLCFALDVAKGLAPALVASLALAPPAGEAPSGAAQAGMLLTAAAAIAGHLFSFWLGFRGGKGVATGLGVVLGIFPYFTPAGAGALAVWIVVTLVSRYVSLGSMVAAAAFLVLFATLHFRELGTLWPMGAFAAAMVAAIIARHADNISRLAKGTEHKIGQAENQATGNEQ